MKNLILVGIAIGCVTFSGVASEEKLDNMTGNGMEKKILYLHHSTGGLVWQGGVKELVEADARERGCPVTITEQAFPKSEPYGWRNYPYDYWNIWVQHAGDSPYKDEPTLEMLTKDYDVILFKHCFPVSSVKEDAGNPDVTSDRKSLENYKLQYAALKEKLHAFPDTTFVVWTSAALVESVSSEAEGKRSLDFVNWVKSEWDTPGDNIFLWDFHALETEGGLFLKEAYSAKPGDSHPNKAFCQRAARLLANRLDAVLQGNGDSASLTGE